MNKLLITLGVLGAAALVYTFFIYEPCKEPSELMVAMTQLNCAVQLMSEDIAGEICKEKGQEPDCVLTQEQDGELAEFVINRKVNKCVKKELEKQNFCTDGVKKL